MQDTDSDRNRNTPKIMEPLLEKSATSSSNVRQSSGSDEADKSIVIKKIGLDLSEPKKASKKRKKEKGALELPKIVTDNQSMYE
jgi:hypothetical protein